MRADGKVKPRSAFTVRNRNRLVCRSGRLTLTFITVAADDFARAGIMTNGIFPKRSAIRPIDFVQIL
jgi:hypothetical protein